MAAAAQPDRPRLGNDRWSLFLRERRLRDQLRRLRNDYKYCHCPPGCRGGPQDHVGIPVDPESPPARPVNGPYVPADRDMPTTWARPNYLRHPSCMAVAEARGTSDIMLQRDRTRATLRMSLQVRTDTTRAGRFAYFGEMFLTQAGQEEEFVGFISSWLMDRSTREEWEDLYLGEWGNRFALTDMEGHRAFFQDIFGVLEEDQSRDQNGNLIPVEYVRQHFAAAWARLGLSEQTDIVYISTIWIQNRVRVGPFYLQPPPLPSQLVLPFIPP